MSFNSIEFLVFYILVFFLYWFVFKRNLRLQNLLLLVGGYVFYAWTDWRLLAYLIGASAVNFYLGLCIDKATQVKHRQWLVALGVAQGVGGLLFFKYFNFFIVSFQDFFHLFSLSLNLHTLNIIVPIGISFFTFKTISYLLDINKGKINATKDWVIFFVYVSFFPTILSGPIDRAKNFIPQLNSERQFDYNKSVEAFKQILWGLFKKVVIADSLAITVNYIFGNYNSFNSYGLIIGAIGYSFQMYTDFSGYSDMAIGFSKLLGFEVTDNFNYPFFAENIAEFWRRWHISLTSWLTEYLFTPLSIYLRDYGKLGVIISTIATFVICGFWHGANWTFVVWGFLHGCYFIPLILKGTFNKRKKDIKKRTWPSLGQFLRMAGTFLLVSLTLIIFRCNTLSDAVKYFKQMLVSSIAYPSQYLHIPKNVHIFYFILPFIMIEWHFRNNNRVLSFNKRYVDAIFYFIIGVLIFLYIGQEEEFIYFKF